MGQSDYRLEAHDAPEDQARAQHSQLPMVTYGGAVIKPICRNAFATLWSILLILENLMN